MGAGAAAASDEALLINISTGDLVVAAALAIFQVLDFLGVVPDPLAALLSLFDGRPREQATAQVINWLETQVNPAARLWGVTLSRLLTDDNIGFSSSSAGE